MDAGCTAHLDVDTTVAGAGAVALLAVDLVLLAATFS
jgi:hypothetical protein